MSRGFIGVLAIMLVIAGTAAAQVCTDDLGVSVTGGMMIPGGGDEEYGDSGAIVGIEIRKLLTGNVSVAAEYRRGVTQSGDEPTVETSGQETSRFVGWGEPDDFRTVWNYAGLSAIYNFSPDSKVQPFVSAGLGLTFWEVQDWRDVTAEEGDVPEGYNTDGKREDLQGANMTAMLGAGVEFFATERVAISVGGRYYLLFQNETDNVGWSAASGPDFVDANNSIIEGYAALSYYFGAGDCDGDGIIGKQDECWNIPEDFDGFEDEDGCPEPDNDMDGILDEDDQCPDDPEDFDGVDDEDGCPDIDRDGDGILDEDDQCPDDPEDIDGYMDADGCPDPDNDGDGVLDGADKCPDTPKGVEVDMNGCPKPKVTMIAVMINFELDKADLTETAKGKLDALATALEDDMTYVIDIAGYACDLGTDSYNNALSVRRANVVRDYLVGAGVAEDRMSVVGYGEQNPLVANNSEEQRKQNRRVMITPSRP
jgi:outer membrane protein OmpA-like peptidoglycan-associated protein/opacity protein-like surface antigen